MKTITLTPNPFTDAVTNCNGTLVVTNVSNFKVGYKLIWIEYNNGASIIAVKRSDYSSMRVDERTNVIINGEGFERINCDTDNYSDF